jgi:hypothetical protein
VLFALSAGVAVPNMGEKGLNPQLLVIASTIIGIVARQAGQGPVMGMLSAVMIPLAKAREMGAYDFSGPQALLRQMAERVLILTPPALVEQWREELVGKFRLGDFVTSFDPVFREQGTRAWETFPRVIASLATARRANIARRSHPLSTT